jgi:hypothetical protein
MVVAEDFTLIRLAVIEPSGASSTSRFRKADPDATVLGLTRRSRSGLSPTITKPLYRRPYGYLTTGH